MLQFLSQQTILFYTMALICAWGVISQVVLRSMYGNLLRDVRRQGMAKGKFMKQLRQRYQNVCRMKQNTVNAFNTEAFIRKNLLEYRLFGGSLHTWKRMAQMAAILCAALGAVGWYISQPQAVGGMRQTYLTGTLLMEGIFLLVFGVLDTGFAKQSLEITLQDELAAEVNNYYGVTNTKVIKNGIPLQEYNKKNNELYKELNIKRDSRSRCSRYWRNFQNRQIRWKWQNAMHRQKKWQLLLSRKTYPDISEKWFPCRDGKRRA